MSTEDKVYDPTTKREREGWARGCESWVKSGEKPERNAWHCEHVLRLLADVEAGERHLQSLKDDAGDMLCDLEDQVKRLEENARFMRDDYSPVGARGCRLCVYEDGVLQRSCRLHQEVARLEAERDRLLLDAAIDKRFR